MNLLAPFALAFGLSVPALLTLYLLKVRRTEREVSSILLWETLRRDLAAHEPWQRLRWSVLLVIQLIVLIGLSIAISRPAVLAPTVPNRFAALVIDTSPSMLATDLPPTRFEQAQTEAQQLVDSSPDGTSIALIETGASPRVVVPETLDRQAVDRSLASLHPLADAAGAQPVQSGVDPSATIDDAISMAEALARGRTDATIHLFSDGAYTHPAGWDDVGNARGDLNLRFHLVGTAAGNQAITAMALRSSAANGSDSTTTSGSGSTLFARIQNFSPEATRVSIALSADGKPIESRPVDLSPDGVTQLFFTSAPSDAHVIQLQLTPPGAFGSDKLATLVRNDQPNVPVLLVTRGNLFLEKALASVPGLSLFQVTPRAFPTVDSGPYSLLVFDGYAPDRPPSKPALLVNPSDAPWLPFQGVVRDPPITLWRNDDPTLAYVDLRSVRVTRASNVVLPDWAHPLIESNGVPLGFVGSNAGQRVVGLTFDLQQSNLPLSAAFPIFVSNVVRYLTPPAIGQAEYLTPGQVAPIRLQPGTERVVVANPSGQESTLPATNSAVQFTQTGSIGLYRVTEVAGSRALATQQFAVNLFSPAESDLRPRANLADHDSAAASRVTKAQSTPTEIAPWLLALLVPLMLGEWWWFHRR